MKLKICGKCKVEKPITDYHMRSKEGTTPKHNCKECERLRSRTYARNNPLPKDVSRERKLQRSFGIGLKEYNELLELQGGRCAICSTESCSSGKSFAVDHDHRTGKIRGLLCRSCNTALGQFKDDETILKKAEQYLVQSKITLAQA